MAQEKGSFRLTADEDRILAFAAAKGDMQAFEALVRRHESALRFFLGRVAGPQQADDLAQDCFIKAWRKAADYRGEGPYRAWLFRIAWHAFLSGRRKRVEEATDALPERSYRPQEEERIDAERALAGLNDEERGAALLCFGQGYSHSEAAGILDLPLGTLKSIVARARTKLVAILGDEG